jgi:hypothetical protein
MELVDEDGDRLEFAIRHGTLCEFVNGILDNPHIKAIKYSSELGEVRDETGVFTLRPETRVEEALGLRALAARAGVVWSGDEPTPANHVSLTDTDGNVLEFCFTENGKLQELNNGAVELNEVTSLHFSYADGVVTDDTGHFKLPAKQCVQKAASLHSLAVQGGVTWTGDIPSQAARPPLLDIENCASDWEFQCPKSWNGLTVTDRADERFCNTCQERVYFCNTVEQLEEHTMHRRCVAFDLSETVARKTAGGMPVRVIMLNGDHLPEVHLSPSQQVVHLKAALTSVSGIPEGEQRLAIQERELLDEETLHDAGITPQVTVTMIRVQPKPQKVDRPRRMMGKRVGR